jgi:hypothetical protein
VGVAVGAGVFVGGGVNPPSLTAPNSVAQYHPYWLDALYTRAIPTTW